MHCVPKVSCLQLLALGLVQRTVKSAFAPEDFNWNSSSGAEYAAFAGVATPESRWTAYANVIESTCVVE
jgi:hypothetical protein